MLSFICNLIFASGAVVHLCLGPKKTIKNFKFNFISVYCKRGQKNLFIGGSSLKPSHVVSCLMQEQRGFTINEKLPLTEENFKFQCFVHTSVAQTFDNNTQSKKYNVNVIPRA
jgi:hypothetical protein